MLYGELGVRGGSDTDEGAPSISTPPAKFKHLAKPVDMVKEVTSGLPSTWCEHS